MKNIEFKFDLEQKVKTVFGDTGIVEMCAIDDGPESKYFVKRSENSSWFKESELQGE